MGFPVVGCCADIALPPLVVYLVLFLGHLRRAIAWALGAVGLGDLLDAEDFPGDPTAPGSAAHGLHPAGPASAAAAARAPYPVRHRHPRALSAALIREALPSSAYEPHGEGRECESCAVCLYELEPAERVRRLGGCRHVFHACCIDPWVDLGRRTCPLCRAPLVPEALRDSLLPAAEPPLDSYGAAAGDLYLADDGDYYPTPQDDGDYYDLDNSLGLPPLEHSRDTEFLAWPTLQDHAIASPPLLAA